MLKDDNHFFHLWATWCQPCLNEFNTFNSILESQGKFQTYFLTDENKEVVKSFLNSHKYDNIKFYGIEKSNRIIIYQALPTTYYSINDSTLIKKTGIYNWNEFFKKANSYGN